VEAIVGLRDWDCRLGPWRFVTLHGSKESISADLSQRSGDKSSYCDVTAVLR